ncbi:Cell division protein FtsQ [Fusobacterium necrogenes]|uniref:Cell division protein FtsQ n=1 Tax=Fusobacterium necrogenes TaxID=858 RepID=A0A377GZ25_9FUSO|nr:cell division protein FtsQ/DivIB [Fusobacterium necrogenes]STO32185.1 Cell division protein FtsQ [Fusobacterium necrogenes]
MKFILRLVFIFLFSWLIYIIPSKFLVLDFFKVKEIKIESNSKILSSELTDMIKIIYNNNIWDIDFKSLEEYLETDVRVEKAEIKILGLDKIAIYIQERKLAYYLQNGENTFLLDSKGKIFGYLKEQLDSNIYFLVAENKEKLEKLLKLSQKLEDILLRTLISQIYLKNDNCIELILTDGTIIKTNLDVEDEKYKVLETLYGELIKTRKIEYIDIRFNDFIVKEFGGEKNGNK